MTVKFRDGKESHFLGESLLDGYALSFKKICVGKNGVHCFTDANNDFFIPFDNVTKDVTIYE